MTHRQFAAILGVGLLLLATAGPAAAAPRGAPRACPAGPTLDVSRDLSRLMGIPNMLPGQPATDSAPLLQQAIGYAIKNSYARITAAPGAYYFLTTSGNEYSHSYYAGVQNASCLTLTFDGASFFFSQPGDVAFYFSGCASCALQDVSIDYGHTRAPVSTLPFTQLLVTSVDTANQSISVSPVQGTGGFTAFPTPMQLASTQASFDPKLVGFDVRNGRPVYSYGRWTLSSVASNTTLTLGSEVSTIQPGDIFILAARGGGPTVLVDDSSGTALQNVSIYTSAGPGVEIDDSERSSLTGVHIVPRPGSNRLMSTVAGGIALNNTGVADRVENCTITGAGDDSIAGYIEGYGVVSATGITATQFTLMGRSNLPVTNGRTRVIFIDGTTGLPLGNGKAAEVFTVTGYDPENYQVTISPALATALQAQLASSRVIDAGTYESGVGLVVDHNVISNSFLARGIGFTGLDGADITNNTIGSTQEAGIYVGMDLACKASQPNCSTGPVHDVRIAGNTLIDTNQGLQGIGGLMLGAIEVSAINASGSLLPQQALQPNRDVVIAGNVVDRTMRAGVWVASITDGAVAPDNILKNVAQGTEPAPPFNNGLGTDPHLPDGLTCAQAQAAFQQTVFSWCTTISGPVSSAICPTDLGPHCTPPH